jgi:uncharacterized metal-binding protein YceD (DUF177 family)
MSTFELKLNHIQSGPTDVDLTPGESELRELFEAFEDEFRLADDGEFDVDLQATLDGETVLLWGEVFGMFDYQCGRCLTERTTEVRGQVDVQFLPEEDWQQHYEGHEEIALEEEDLDTYRYEDGAVDLGPVIRDAITLALPAWPRCPDEKQEQCDEAYQEHVGEETIEQMEHNSVDLQWWPLRDIDLDGDDEEEDETEPEN